jgi:hypothetical protein
MYGNAVENGAGIGVASGMDVDECLEMSDRDKLALAQAQAQVPVHVHVQAHATVTVGGWIPADKIPSSDDRRSLPSGCGWDAPFASASANSNLNTYGNSTIPAPNYSFNNHNTNTNNINVFLEASTASSPCSNSFATSDPFYLSVAQLAAAADCRRKLEPKTFAMSSPLRFNPNPVQFGSLNPQSQPQMQPQPQPHHQTFNQYQAHAQTSYQHQHPSDLWGARRTELDPTLLQYR